MQITLRHGEIAVVGHAPNAGAGGVDGDVGRCCGEGLEELVVLFLGGSEACAINLRNKVQGTHGVGGSGAIHVPLVLNGTLKCGEPVSVLLNVRIAGGHAHVVHEDGELAKTEGIHFLKFAHDVIDDGGAINEVISRVNRPDEIHLGGLRGLCQLLHHVLREPSVGFLLCGYGSGVGIFPKL